MKMLVFLETSSTVSCNLSQRFISIAIPRQLLWRLWRLCGSIKLLVEPIAIWVFPDVPGGEWVLRCSPDRSNGNCWGLRLGGIPYWKVTIFVGRWGTIDECADVGRPLGWMGELLQRRMGPIRGCRGLEKGGGHGQWSGSAYGGPFRLQCLLFFLQELLCSPVFPFLGC